MCTQHRPRRMIAIAFACFGWAIMASGVQAGVILVGGDTDHSFRIWNGIVLNQGEVPAEDFLMAGPTLYEVKAITRGPNNNIYVLEGTEPGDDEVGGGSPELVYEYSPGGLYLGVAAARQDYGVIDLRTEGEATALAFGPDGNLYVAVAEAAPGGQILRFNGQTGAFIDIFVADGSGGPNFQVSEPTAVLFSPAGDLYVADDDGILRFSSTGSFLSEVIYNGSEPLYEECKALAWRNGRLYAANQDNDNILVVDFNPDGSTSNASVFASGGGLEEPQDIGFGPDGYLYVVDGDGLNVYRYNGNTGAFVDYFVDLKSEGDIYHDPYGFIFFFEDVEVPLLGPMSLALLALGLAGLAGVVLLRRRSRVQVS